MIQSYSKLVLKCDAQEKKNCGNCNILLKMP